MSIRLSAITDGSRAVRLILLRHPSLAEVVEEGDYLLITPNSPCNCGDIVMARTKEVVVVGRYAEEEDSVALEPLAEATQRTRGGYC